MERDNLTPHPKDEYVSLAAAKNQLLQREGNITSDAHYENLLGMAAADIAAEVSDSRKLGRELIEEAAGNKRLPTQWTLNDPRR